MTGRDRPWAALGGLCLAGALLLVLVDARAALGGWLSGFVLCSAVPLGALLLIMMMYLIPGSWRAELLPVALDMQWLLPAAAVAVLPVIVASPVLYPWAAEVIGGWRGLYLTVEGFALRTGLFFLGAMALSFALASRPGVTSALSAAGLIGFVVADTTVVVDWLMSLAAHFHSSGFGLYVLSIQATVALAVLLIARLWATRSDRMNLLGGLLLTSLLLWAYLAFMQFFIVWSDNLSEGARWYLRRAEGGWAVVEWIMAASQLVPTLLLFLAPVRRGRVWLIALSAIVVAGKALEVAWLVAPETGNPAILGMAFAATTAGLVLVAPAAAALTQGLLRRPVARVLP
ncbi:MAG: hypothetical protein ACOY4R_07075 [Pseudomonadota bacterium]